MIMTRIHSCHILMLLLTVTTSSASFDCCEDDFSSSAFIEPKITYRDFYYIEIPDPDDGCFCKQFPNKYAKCCGGDDCHRIPPDMNFTEKELRIVTTGILKVSRNDFAKYSIIEKLKIDNNYNLELIEDFSFLKLTNLVNLSISYNQKLNYLKPLTFVGLANLKELHLIHNGFNRVIHFSEALVPRYLPSLTDLVLKQNNFLIIDNVDFSPMQNSSLKKLDLSECRIDLIDSGSLTYLKHLEELEIGSNFFSIENITNLMIKFNENGMNLKQLGLSKIGLKRDFSKKLLEAVGNSTIQCLSLAGNQLEVIKRDSFPVMENIKSLDLRDVSAISITEDAFDNLPNLKKLFLGNNKFSSIPLGSRIENLTVFDISYNAGYDLSRSYFTLSRKNFANMTKLNVLNLSFNTIQTIYESTFLGLSNLRILSLKRCDIFYIGENTFLPLENLLFLDLEGNSFAISKPEVVERNLFEGLDKLEVLLLGRNNISRLSNVTFSSLKSLTYLSLIENTITYLDSLHFMNLFNLGTIDLDKNSLVPWNHKRFNDNLNLTHIYLSKNKLSTLTSSMLDDLQNVTYADFSDNNFICDCHLFHSFRNWTAKHGQADKIIKIIESSNATCFPNKKPVSEYLLQPENERKCGKNYVAIIVPSVLFFVVLITVISLVYFYRWHLRYYLFLTKLHLIRKGKIKTKTNKSCDTNFEYDAFVSYSNEDRSFIMKLVSMLENYEPFFRLCVYERDFKVGGIISESILESVGKSRKVLLIISDNYVKSQWCQWETHIAQHCNLFSKQETGEPIDDSLIMIKLGKICLKNLTPTLKYLLKTRVYLEWDNDKNKQSTFWEKLKANLARGKKELPREDINGIHL